MLLEKAENLFLAYYYRVVLRGTYPLITDLEAKNFKKFSRDILEIKKGSFIEVDILDVMRNLEKRSQLSKAIRIEFPRLFKTQDRGKALLDQLTSIKEKIINSQMEVKMTNPVNSIPIQPEEAVKQTRKQVNQEVGNVIPVRIKEWEQKNEKRFRMTKEQKNRGLSREEAFTEAHKN